MPGAIYSAGDFSSQARFLFESFTGADGVANIRALVGQTPKVFETNYLEFKSGLTQAEDVKQKWSQALGSFANSGGGVVIWGISADRDKGNSIDSVQKEVSVPDAEKLAAKLREYQPSATDPPIKGVEVKPMLIPKEGGKGFVVCFIPESDAKPHRSEVGKNDVKRYNLRIGDSTQECTPAILRQLFYPRAVLRAEIDIEAIHVPPQIGPMTFHHDDGSGGFADREDGLKLSIRNTGLFSFHDLMANIRCGSAYVGKYDFSSVTQSFKFELLDGDFQLTRILHPKRCISRSLVVACESANVNSAFEITLFARDMEPISGKIDLAQIVAKPWVKHTQQLGTEGSFK